MSIVFSTDFLRHLEKPHLGPQYNDLGQLYGIRSHRVEDILELVDDGDQSLHRKTLFEDNTQVKTFVDFLVQRSFFCFDIVFRRKKPIKGKAVKKAAVGLGLRKVGQETTKTSFSFTIKKADFAQRVSGWQADSKTLAQCFKTVDKKIHCKDRNQRFFTWL